MSSDEKIYPDLASAQEALDRGETVRIALEPFLVDAELIQKALDLYQKERFEAWKRDQARAD